MIIRRSKQSALLFCRAEISLFSTSALCGGLRSSRERVTRTAAKLSGQSQGREREGSKKPRRKLMAADCWHCHLAGKCRPPFIDDVTSFEQIIECKRLLNTASGWPVDRLLIEILVVIL